MEHNCWKAAHSKGRQCSLCGILYVYISGSKYLMTVATKLISYCCTYLVFFCRDLVRCILENLKYYVLPK